MTGNELHVVTGAGSGIGRALARALAEAGHAVVAVGRREAPLRETAAGLETIRPLPADVASEAGRARIAEAVGGARLRWLVHNAGVLEPVGPLLEAEPEALRYALAVNVEAPIHLTRALRPALAGGSRVLHVSSGAAHRPVPGWGAYCLGKAALHMAYQVLREELRPEGIAVGSVRPGVVDTPMQTLIRSQPESAFPAVERFRALKARGELEPPERVARFILALLELQDVERFGAAEWDIREHAASLGIA
ncbi:SDR family NAD(P)-dependent oxidoreductase [Spiribacter halobius]|uniref:Short-chain dehydrogenase n=1 Tax=Sediminicurvatus halobius TaxID=2182432 RepID=A0A2U2N8L6_9GAMM|nr:SDR family NAD(P)-dependent oxidoreductase [Spiribacter halobius]PWG65535.1 short-chain dehydrogenase [Spiribacter halobius]UEX76560.1 SDR family NAD(P)-dependent oxidoreductase [Spiribacter halobius]